MARAHTLGARTELITNGMLLNERLGRELIDVGLDLLWVSIDGASPESYANVRLGAELAQVIANVARFSKMRKGGHHPRPELGIAFVAMKRNIADLPRCCGWGLSWAPNSSPSAMFCRSRRSCTIRCFTRVPEQPGLHQFSRRAEPEPAEDGHQRVDAGGAVRCVRGGLQHHLRRA